MSICPYWGVVLSCLVLACKDKTSEEALDPCVDEGALASCLSPTQSAEYYVTQSDAYFDTMDSRVDLQQWPPYSELVARWEWPPWLKLTAFTREHIESSDTMLRQLLPSIVEDRVCEAFDTQPFGRCYVVFYYEEHDGLGCPIYEEFTFNDQGEITFIEAWSDLPEYLPMDANDTWAEADDVPRLSTRVPGLGNETGLIDLDGEAMTAAAETDVDVADFVVRANDWAVTWQEELEAAGDDLWDRGCGW